MRGSNTPLLLLNVVVLSIIAVGNVSWRCLDSISYNLGDFDDKDAPRPRPASPAHSSNDDQYYDDHPRVDLDEEYEATAVRSEPPLAVAFASDDGGARGDDHSYLSWGVSPVSVPENWIFRTPNSCRNITDHSHVRESQKIIIHYHMQHNAGTSFYAFAKRFTTCATRACWQTSRHCLVSYNEEVEAQNLRDNYREHGVQYVSYEMMLPPKFPLPFISDTAREGLFFTTIVRDPFARFLTFARRTTVDKARPMRNGTDGTSPFWADLRGSSFRGIYQADNLNARWLAGVMQGDRVSPDNVNLAKCRLQLFDLVIADKLYDTAVREVMCPLNEWRDGLCSPTTPPKTHNSTKKDPLDETDRVLIGAWIERLRPSFEIYDYARILSLKHLESHGVSDIPTQSDVPSYLQAMVKYTGLRIDPKHFKTMPRVNLQNEAHYEPPAAFCERMKKVWRGNKDEVVDAFGIGTIKTGF